MVSAEMPYATGAFLGNLRAMRGQIQPPSVSFLLSVVRCLRRSQHEGR